MVAGALVGGWFGWLFSPTLRRFAGGTGSTVLPEFSIRGDLARIEWSAAGGICITDVGHANFGLRSAERVGSERLPAGSYHFQVSASAPWVLRIARG